MNYIQFKTDRIASEYETLLDYRLRAMLLEQAHWQFNTFASPLIITCIGRTPEENAGVGGVEHSAHLILPGHMVRAADVRSWNIPITKMGLWLSRLLRWNDKLPGFVHAIYHSARTGPHFHVNINMEYKLNPTLEHDG